MGAPWAALPAWAAIVISSMFVTSANAILSGILAEDAPDFDATAGSQGHLINTRDTQRSLPRIYGRCRVGINQVYLGVSGTDNKYIHIIGTIGEGEVEGIAQTDSVDQVFLNDELYTEFGSLVYYEFFTGTSTQNVCTTLYNAIPEWNDPLRHTAYIYMRIEYDQDRFQNLPTITLEIEGLKVYDPRDETTAYSNNAALATRDLILASSLRGGMQIESTRLDIDSWKDTANYCDAKGWTIGMPIGKIQAVIDNVAATLCIYRGALIYSDNKFKCRYKDLNYESAVMNLTEDDIVEINESTLKILQPSIFDTPNAIRLKFLNTETKYQADDYVKSDSSAIAADGDYREKELEILGINSLENAMKMANYFLERFRINKTVSFTGRDRCMSLEPMDLIQLTHSFPGWENKLLRVINVQFAGDLVQLDTVEEESAFYDDIYNLADHEWHDTNLPRPSDTPYSVINVSHSEEVYYYRDRSFTRWKIDFDKPAAEDYPWWDYAEIWIKVGVAGDWTFATKVTTDYMRDPVEEGETYYCKIRSVSIHGVKENFDSAYTVSKQIVGKTGIPSDMLAITAVASGDTVNVYGDEISETDISVYELRLGEAWVGGIFIAANETPNFRLAGVKPGMHTFWCKAKDNSGNYATNAASATVIVFYPPGYSDKNTWSWDYDGIGEHDNTEHIIYAATDCLKCSHGIVTGDLLNENCSDISDWVDGDVDTAVSEVSPAGQFRFDTNVGAAGNAYAYRYRDIGSIPAKVTFEIRLLHNAIGTNANSDFFNIVVHDGTNYFDAHFCSDGLFIYDGATYNEVGINLVKQGGSAEWQIWRFVITMGSVCDVYLHDSTHTAEKVGTNIDCSATSGEANGLVKIAQFGYATNNMLTHVDYIRIQDGFIPIDVLLRGTWVSPEYDLGSSKTVRVWADFLTVFSSSAVTWEGIFPDPTLWSEKIDANTRWYELTTPDVAAILEAKIKWGTSSGVYPNEADFFQILAPEFTARYIQVEIKITDPQSDANLYLKLLNLKAAYWC